MGDKKKRIVHELESSKRKNKPKEEKRQIEKCTENVFDVLNSGEKTPTAPTPKVKGSERRKKKPAEMNES